MHPAGVRFLTVWAIYTFAIISFITTYDIFLHYVYEIFSGP